MTQGGCLHDPGGGGIDAPATNKMNVNSSDVGSFGAIRSNNRLPHPAPMDVRKISFCWYWTTTRMTRKMFSHTALQVLNRTVISTKILKCFCCGFAFVSRNPPWHYWLNKIQLKSIKQFNVLYILIYFCFIYNMFLFRGNPINGIENESYWNNFWPNYLAINSQYVVLLTRCCPCSMLFWLKHFRVSQPLTSLSN